MSLVKDPTIVYICYPTTTGNINENINTILNLCLDIQTHCPNTIPIAPYLMFMNYLDISDPAQMSIVVKNTREFFRRKSFDEMWVAGQIITEEMTLQIEWAIDYDIPTIAYTPLIVKDLEIMMEEYENLRKVLH